MGPVFPGLVEPVPAGGVPERPEVSEPLPDEPLRRLPLVPELPFIDPELPFVEPELP